MALGDVIARLAVSLTMETAAFDKGATINEKRLAQSQKNFEKIGKSMTGLGQKLSLALTVPLTAFGVASVKAAAESRDAMGQVESALKSMGGAAGRTKDQLADLASKQMRQSLYDDDEILRKVTANLLTFGKISGASFDRAQQAAIDLSARLGTDLQSSAVMVGKALNDPVKGVTALTRVGVSFTDQQKAQIKAMAEAGNVAGAQKLILGELSKQYGGSAKAALEAAGPLAQLRKRYDEISETVGGVLLTALDRIAPYITRIADAFSNLSPQTQTFIVAALGIAAALGPVLLGLGSLISISAPVIAGFAGIHAALVAVEGITVAGYVGGWVAAFGSLLATLAPVALAVGAIYIAWKNWDDIAPRLTPIIGELRGIAEWLGLIGPKAKDAGDKSKDATSDLEDLGEAAQNASNKFQSWADAFDAYNARTAKSARENHTTIQDGLHQLWAGFTWFTEKLNGWGASIKAALASAVNTMASIGKDIILGLARGIRVNPQAVWDALKSVITSGIDKAKALLGIRSPSRVFMEIGDYIAQGLAVGIEGGKGKVDEATRRLTEAARKAAEETKALFARLFPELEQANNYRDDLKRIDGANVSSDAKDQARRRLGLEATGTAGDIPLSDTVQEQGALIGGSIDDVLGKFDQFGKKSGAVAVQVAKSFKDMADATIQSLQNLAGAIKGGGFLDILSAVVGLGLQLGSIGAFGKKIQTNINSSKVPGYASGTDFHPGGLAIVGERGPELVSMPRGSRVTPNGEWGARQSAHVTVGIDPRNGNVTAYVDGRIAASAPALIDGGGRAGVGKVAYQQRRRVA